MSLIFFSYRREDESGAEAAELLFERFSKRFGTDCVFLDQRSLQLGIDFEQDIKERLQNCAVVLAIIGDDWLGGPAGTTRTRLHEPDDWVRRELLVARDFEKEVIPVCVGHRPLPRPNDLPEELRWLVGLHASNWNPGKYKKQEVEIAMLADDIEAILDRHDEAERAGASNEEIEFPDVFICNASSDAQAALASNTGLNDAGILSDYIGVGARPQSDQTVHDLVERCHLVIVLYSDKTNDSEFVKMTLDYLAHHQHEAVLLLRLDDSRISGELARHLAAAEDVCADEEVKAGNLDSLLPKIRRLISPLIDSIQLPDEQLAAGLGEVNILRVDDELRIVFSLLDESTEKMHTGIAFDASRSMTGLYGRNVIVSADAYAHYEKIGEITNSETDGRVERRLTQRAIDDAQSKGANWLRRTANEVQLQARRFVPFLAEQIGINGTAIVAYWACGEDGMQFEIVGNLTAAGCQDFGFNGPQRQPFGDRTMLTPIVREYVGRCNGEKGRFLFITDGQIQDREELRQYTNHIAGQIARGERKPVKLVLIGIGDDVDEAYMQELDDVFGYKHYDVWDHKFAGDLKNIRKILAEPLDPDAEVPGCDWALIRDDQDRVLKRFDSQNNRLTIQEEFPMSADSHWFELEMPGNNIIRQYIDHSIVKQQT